jgi:hypothetical protein
VSGGRQGYTRELSHSAVQDVVELTVKLNERVISTGGRSGTAAPLIGWRLPSRTAVASAAASETTPRA